MTTRPHILPHSPLSPGASILRGDSASASPVNPSDPAISVLTDFRHARPFSIESSATLEQVNARMIACGVRLLFVTDSANTLQGLVTYTDLFGEKPLQYIQEHGGNREQIEVHDIMTVFSRLESLRYTDVLEATVGDIAETIREIGRQHLLVSQMHSEHGETIVGMFSSTHIERRTGIRLELSARASTFADLERALT